ncbi:MAG: 1-acyl-sn-glycerol-3-phosphate acyltransferase [Myxococcaceae bacterium]|nr:1-acyl-sn-glycerol-3-phosphate acyltransferase [Myxococcaceae bacterium]
MNQHLRTLLAGSAAVGLTGAASTLVSALSLIGEEAMDPVLVVWARSVLAASGVRHEARGLENLPPGNFVLAVNHQSHFDSMVLFAHIHRHMRFIAKQQLRRIPVFGYALARAGNVFVDRTGSDRDKSKLHDSVRAVQERVSIVFFAEGTRSKDGKLAPFKKGAAVLAIEAGVPLVPAAVAGTYDILPAGKIAIQARPAALVIGKPLLTTGLTLDDRDRLTEQAHARVAECLLEAEAIVEQLRRG